MTAHYQSRKKGGSLRPKAVLYTNGDGTASGRFPDGMYDFVATADAEKGLVMVHRYDSMAGGDPTATLTFIVVGAENPLEIPSVENPTWKLQRVKMGDSAQYALVRIVRGDDLLVGGDPLKL